MVAALMEVCLTSLLLNLLSRKMDEKLWDCVAANSTAAYRGKNGLNETADTAYI